VRVAHQLARLGVDVIEAGFPASSPAQREAVRRISNEVDGPVICALARATTEDIDAAGEALAGGSKRRIHTFIATSDIHLQAKFDHPRYGSTLAEKRRTVIAKATAAIAHARRYTTDVEFSAEDAGRTDPGYLCEVVSAAAAAGATTINIPDTTGYCTPGEYSALIREVVACLPHNVIVSCHCHDDLGLAVANSLEAVRAGARQVEVAVNGIGERAGNASLEEVVMALHVRADHFGAEHRIQTQLLTETSRMVSLATSFPVPPNKAIVGGNAFAHEAGIHQHGVLKCPETYEIMRAQDVGQNPESRIRLGRHSGRHGFFSRLESLGIAYDTTEADALFGAFTELADKKREVYDTDLISLIHSTNDTMQDPAYRLDRLAVHVQTNQKASAEVTLTDTRHERVATTRAEGDGPVDALYHAIDEATGSSHDLASYEIRSVSEGADAVGEVTVLIGYAHAYFRGTARSVDVLQASAYAYVEALNHLERFRSEEESHRFVASGIMSSFDPQDIYHEVDGRVNGNGGPTQA
jgi:2-isopropylmalate synthase